jgi:hypothetical protein
VLGWECRHKDVKIVPEAGDVSLQRNRNYQTRLYGAEEVACSRSFLTLPLCPRGPTLTHQRGVSSLHLFPSIEGYIHRVIEHTLKLSTDIVRFSSPKQKTNNSSITVLYLTSLESTPIPIHKRFLFPISTPRSGFITIHSPHLQPHQLGSGR